MIKRIQSRLWKCGDRDRDDGASFYGALNSDEVARSILGDPNYRRTDKQTTGGNRGGENIGDVQKQDCDISKEVVAMFFAIKRERVRRTERIEKRETVRKYDGSTLGFSKREDEI